MFTTVPVLSVRSSTCLPRKRPLRRFKARRTARNSRQLMCQCSWGPVQTTETASPSNMPPSRWWRHLCKPQRSSTAESSYPESSGSPSDAAIDIRRSAKDTAGTLLVEGPAHSIGSSTGFEERWSLEGWFPGGFATTVILSKCHHLK